MIANVSYYIRIKAGVNLHLERSHLFFFFLEEEEWVTFLKKAIFILKDVLISKIVTFLMLLWSHFHSKIQHNCIDFRKNIKSRYFVQITKKLRIFLIYYKGEEINRNWTYWAIFYLQIRCIIRTIGCRGLKFSSISHILKRISKTV